jgi:hypothetical protein
VTLKRFFAPECVFILGMGSGNEGAQLDDLWSPVPPASR